MELRAEYPELGPIPTEWEVRTLGGLGRLEMGKGLLKGELQPYGEIPAIPYTSLYTDFSEVIDLKDTKWYIERESAKYVVSTPCVLMASSSNVAANTGKACALAENSPVAIGREVIVLKTQQCVAYISYLLSQARYRQRTLELAKGTTIKHVYPTTFSNYAIALPPEAEQRAIASALSDVDALIAGLERLIAKKRDIKQAAMQQLLTGQTRLPGFSGEWLGTTLGEIAHIKTGSRNNEDKVEDGTYPFFVRSSNVERINSFSHECEAILVPGEGQIGNIFHYIKGRFDVHQRVYAITQFAEEVSGRFIHLFMSQHFGAWAMQNTVKATVDSLRLPTFQTFAVSLPPTRDEQTAIATVLSDMDADLSALESRLAKTRAIKQGMMQELLTGRTRLL